MPARTSDYKTAKRRRALVEPGSNLGFPLLKMITRMRTLGHLDLIFGEGEMGNFKITFGLLIL